MGRKSEGRKKQRRETGENTNTGYLSRAFCSRAPNHCFSTLSMRYFLNPPPSAPISLLFLSFSPSSSFSSSEQRGSAWMEETCRPKNSSHVARRRQAARVARLFRKRICTFEKRGVTREPARWFDKENGRGGVMESDGSTLPVIEQTGRIQGEKAFLTHRCQPSTFPMVGDFCSQPFPCLRKSLVNDTLSRLYFFLSFYF